MWAKYLKRTVFLLEAAALKTRGMCTATMGPKETSSSLYRRLSALAGITDSGAGDAGKVLDEWVKEGKPIKIYNIKGYIRELRKYKRFNHAIQLMEWMEARGTNLSYSDHAIHIDLLSKVKGIDAAEKFFTGLPEPAKNQSTYGALLCCYTKGKMHEKAIALFEKMRELEFAFNSLNYNNVMSLYMKLGNPEKVPPLIEEMKAKGVLLDRCTYTLLMNSYASLGDIEAVERVMEEAKMKEQVCGDWALYSNLAAIYVAAGLSDKANFVLQELEKTINLRDRRAFHFLISLYASTSNLVKVKRVWESLRSAFTKTTNVSYFVMLQSLAKLGDMDGLKKCFHEWESGCSSYDVRLANVLINAYVKRGMIKEASTLLKRIFERGVEPNFWTMSTFIDFYLKNHQMELAMKCMETALSKLKENKLQPTKEKVKLFFRYFEEEKDVDGAEAFKKMLKRVHYPFSDFHGLLLRTYVAAGKVEPEMP